MSKPFNTTSSEVMFNCPACGVDVLGQIAATLELDTLDGQVVTATGKITGVLVSHNCIPKTTR